MSVLIDIDGLVLSPAEKAREEHGPRVTVSIGQTTQKKCDFSAAQAHRSEYSNFPSVTSGYKDLGTFFGNVAVTMWNGAVDAAELGANIITDFPNTANRTGGAIMTGLVNIGLWAATDKHKVEDLKMVAKDPKTAEQVMAVVLTEGISRSGMIKPTKGQIFTSGKKHGTLTHWNTMQREANILAEQGETVYLNKALNTSLGKTIDGIGGWKPDVVSVAKKR